MRLSRTAIVASPLLASLLLAGCGSVRAPEPPLAGEPVASGIALLRGRFVAGAQPDGNSVLLRVPDGLVVYDSGRHAAQTQRILDAARAARLPIVAIVNSHWHLDHVSGNAMLRDVYPQVRVYASDAIGTAMTGYLADYRAQLQDAIAQAPPDSHEAADWREELARIDAGARLFPTDPVTTPGSRRLGGRAFDVGLERDAVSGGDVWLYDAATRTLLAGDLVTLPAPLFDTACAAGWSRALARLDALGFAKLVPGHGAVLGHAQFATYRTAFDHLLACASSDAPAAQCKAGWLRDAAPLIPAEDVALAGSLLDYYIPQVLRAPEPRRSRDCHQDDMR